MAWSTILLNPYTFGLVYIYLGENALVKLFDENSIINCSVQVELKSLDIISDISSFIFYLICFTLPCSCAIHAQVHNGANKSQHIYVLSPPPPSWCSP